MFTEGLELSKPRRVLITGGMGFIGKPLCYKLLNKKNYYLTIIDNLSSSRVDKNNVDKILKDAEEGLKKENIKDQDRFILEKKIEVLNSLNIN